MPSYSVASTEAVISRDARTNRRIRAREVRVIGPEGESLGILPLEVALTKATESGFDLVEVQPMAKPPVCKIMDYGRFKYETKKKANEAKKKQVVVKIKEIKLRPRTDEHDYDVKLRQTREFLEEGHKVKVTIVFRGREIAHREIGQKQLTDMVAELKDVAMVEQAPRMEGRAMFMMLGAAKASSGKPASSAPRPASTSSGAGAPAPAGAGPQVTVRQAPVFQPPRPGSAPSADAKPAGPAVPASGPTSGPV